jgi:UDP-galactopyranose mutase
MKKTQVLIVGGGFAGCATADFFANHDKFEVTLIERGGFLGAGVRTLFYGGHPYTFGPRHFLTQESWIYEYLDKKIPMRLCSEHQFVTFVEHDSRFYSYPIHEDDVSLMPESLEIKRQLKECKLNDFKDVANLEEYWIKSVGEILYNKFIKEYSHKMWLIQDNKLIDDFGWSPKGTALKRGPRAAWDTAISAYPLAIDGYNKYFDIATRSAKVLLNTEISEFDIPNKTVCFNGQNHLYDIIVNTISPDLLFKQCYGELPYVGRDLVKIVLPVEFALPKDVFFSYYAGIESYTRVCEYKKFSGYKSPSTLITIETPSRNGRFYPMPFKSEYTRADMYFNLMPDNVFSIGRSGSYRYQVDIDDCISQARNIVEEVTK